MIKLSYDLIINGYDWGPGADKVIIHCENEYTDKKINTKDFTVTTETLAYNWKVMPPALELKKVDRIIKAAYPCNSEGSRLSKSNLIALELAVHPDDFASNPFLYGSDWMNHWQKIYDFVIENKKLNIYADKLNEKICPLADKFTIGQSKTDDITLHYALYEPDGSFEKTPMIIWLHGMGEGGNDPYIALLGNKVVNLITDDVQSCFGSTGAFVLAPQANGFWMQTEKNGAAMDKWINEKSGPTKSYFTEALYNLICEVIDNNPKIDKKRIYIGGCSNGGYMTINMLLEYPELFAAAYPVCEAYPDSRIDDEKLNVLSKHHIWFTQSKDDKTVFPDKYAVSTVKRLKDLKSDDIHFSLWENVSDTTGNYKDKNGNPYKYNGHFSWIYALNNQCEENGIRLFEWMSKISK